MWQKIEVLSGQVEHPSRNLWPSSAGAFPYITCQWLCSASQQSAMIPVSPWPIDELLCLVRRPISHRPGISALLPFIWLGRWLSGRLHTYRNYHCYNSMPSHFEPVVTHTASGCLLCIVSDSLQNLHHWLRRLVPVCNNAKSSWWPRWCHSHLLRTSSVSCPVSSRKCPV